MTRRQALLAIPLAPVALGVAVGPSPGEFPLPLIDAQHSDDARLLELANNLEVFINGENATAADYKWVDEASGTAGRWGREGEPEVVVERAAFRLELVAGAPSETADFYRELRAGRERAYDPCFSAHGCWPIPRRGGLSVREA